MRQVRWASWMVGLAMALAIGGVRPVAADVTSDQAAAILDWPSVIYAESGSVGILDGIGINTIIQLSNTSSDPVHVHCFYENANSHCTNSGFICEEASDCCDLLTGCGVCAPGWNETDFNIQITPFQPLGWLASDGVAGFDSTPPVALGKFALDGVTSFGIGGSSNAGSRIPGVPEEPFLGSLRCIAVDEDGFPVDRNVLKGEATIGLINGTPAPGEELINVGKSNAVGIQAIEGQVNDDNVLVLGGPEPEYNGCPNILILNHFFDFAEDPIINDGSEIFTLLDLVPCSEDYLRQQPGATVVQYLVYNEFEERFSTSKTVICKQFLPLSSIDTTQPQRSIWSAGVSGTLTGQTRINGIGGGLIAVAHELHEEAGLADFNVHIQGDRVDPDFIVLP
ncbi:MAG: hypothetical protein ACRD3J_12505, partial [Thermoanaerobaculia bacterium]